MSGKRRRPYAVKKTVGWHYDPVKDRQVQEQITIGYAATRAEGLQMLAEYNNNPFDIKASKATFQEVYERWSKEKFPTISKSNVKGYEASYRVCGTLYNKVFRDIRLMDLQFVVDTCGKNYPTLKKLKGLFNQLYAYAMKNDICNKDYSEFVDLSRYKDKNPNKRDRNKFTKEQIARLWELAEDPYYDQTPHCTRHTCISMLTEAHVDQTMIKKIVGHSGAMTLTERVYTHLDIETLVEAINSI